MKKRYVCTIRILLIVAVMGGTSILSGCAIGTTQVKIAHNRIQSVDEKREGTFLVKPFVDVRGVGKKIGNKRNTFGMVFGHVAPPDGVSIGNLLTEYFVEALHRVGYQADIYDKTVDYDKETYDAIIEGEIVEFWMDLYMAVWHRVGVKVKALDVLSEKVLWEKLIQGAEKRVLWIGATSEYERIIREAITKALNKAVQEFSSDEFVESVTQ